MKYFLSLIILVLAYTNIQPVQSATIVEMPVNENVFILDVLTIYNPVAEQCDSDPLITASLAKINLHKLRKQQIRWMAVSRDMLSRWGGKLNYGDTVIVSANDSSIDGKWVIQDTMNKRYKKYGDLLFDQSIRKLGRWTNVKLTKITYSIYDQSEKQKLPQDSPG